MDKGHGRKEVRQLWSTTALNGYLDWPDVGQVFELERVRVSKGAAGVDVVYGVSGLSPQQAGAARMLELVRGHWGVENGLHWVRDVTLGGDACRVRTGSSPQVLAALRNAAVHLLEGVEAASKAAATRRFHVHPSEALPLLFT